MYTRVLLRTRLLFLALGVGLGLLIYGQSPQLPSGLRTKFLPDDPAESMFLVTFGERSGNTRSWTGEVSVSGGELETLRGYKFDLQDEVLPPNRWTIAAHPAVGLRKPTHFYPANYKNEPSVGIILTILAKPECKVRISGAKSGALEFRPAEIGTAARKSFFDGDVRVIRLPVAREIGSNEWQDDYPSIAADRQGALWAAWTGYHAERDDLGLRCYKDGVWSVYLPVPGATGDVWWPQVVVDANDDPWVVWAQMEAGNWDIYTAGFHKADNQWTVVERISSDAMVDSNPTARMDKAGNLFVAWQGFRGRNSQILLRVRRNGAWSETYTVAAGPANNWEPSLAVDSSGRAWIAWDTYRNGNYDVYLRSFQDGHLNPETPVATTPRYEARASLAVDAQDRVWIAWEEGDTQWGKDRGFYDVAKYTGTPFGGHRTARVAVFANGRLQSPVAQPDSAAIEGTESFQPRLFFDSSGNPGLLLLRRLQKYAESPQGFWEHQATFYQGDHWTAFSPLPLSWNRESTRGAAVAGPHGQVWYVYSTDGREYAFPTRPLRSRVFAAHWDSLPAAEPRLGEMTVENVPPGSTHSDEPGDLRAIRSYRTKVNSVDLAIVRGDTHRHTEMSYDEGGTLDGSVLDFFRYALDAGSLDWGNVSDHQGGGNYNDYYHWLTAKLVDMHHITGAFTSLFGYERSALYPDGHRNVISASRSLKVLPFLRMLEFDNGARYPGDAPDGHVPAGNDTKYLYKELHRTGAISIPHTPGTDMGTNWRDNDPEVEPVVEIYQGIRNSYESPGAPLTASSVETAAPGGYHPEGFVNNAWAKGYRLGVIASSDHMSSHMSYAMVYTADRSRQGIIDAIKKRRTYGATDNIILEYRMGQHFMGDDFQSKGCRCRSGFTRGARRPFRRFASSAIRKSSTRSSRASARRPSITATASPLRASITTTSAWNNRMAS